MGTNYYRIHHTQSRVLIFWYVHVATQMKKTVAYDSCLFFSNLLVVISNTSLGCFLAESYYTQNSVIILYDMAICSHFLDTWVFQNRQKTFLNYFEVTRCDSETSNESATYSYNRTVERTVSRMFQHYCYLNSHLHNNVVNFLRD
jgi:hypothetical protein